MLGLIVWDEVVGGAGSVVMKDILNYCCVVLNYTKKCKKNISVKKRKK